MPKAYAKDGPLVSALEELGLLAGGNFEVELGAQTGQRGDECVRDVLGAKGSGGVAGRNRKP